MLGPVAGMQLTAPARGPTDRPLEGSNRTGRLLRSSSRWLLEAGAPVGLSAAIAVSQRDLLAGGAVLGMDTATAFYPWYSFLGQRLRAGAIPAWNPYQFSGTPFAADPESGWMYLPAMAFFTTLPLPDAATGYLLFHVLLAGLSPYALARTLGLGSGGSLLASFAYSCSGFLYGHNACCFAYAGVTA